MLLYQRLALEPRRLVEPIARLLAKAGISPNFLSLLGLLLSVGVAFILAQGQLFWGGWLLLVAGICDTLDGMVARAAGRASRFGALFDSTLDRLSEAAVLFGLLVLFLNQGAVTEVMLVYGAMVTSILISYVKARAEGLALQGRGGIMPREVRVVALAFGLIVNQVAVLLWLLCILNTYSALDRLWRAGREAAQRADDGN